MRTRYLVQCTEAIPAQQWVYAESEEEAFDVIHNNFHWMTPLIATKIVEKPPCFMFGVTEEDYE